MKYKDEMKNKIEKINFTVETIKITAKERKIGKGWKIEMDKNGTLRMWYEKPVAVLPDELFEI